MENDPEHPGRGDDDAQDLEDQWPLVDDQPGRDDGDGRHGGRDDGHIVGRGEMGGDVQQGIVNGDTEEGEHDKGQLVVFDYGQIPLYVKESEGNNHYEGEDPAPEGQGHGVHRLDDAPGQDGVGGPAQDGEGQAGIGDEDLSPLMVRFGRGWLHGVDGVLSRQLLPLLPQVLITLPMSARKLFKVAGQGYVVPGSRPLFQTNRRRGFLIKSSRRPGAASRSAYGGDGEDAGAPQGMGNDHQGQIAPPEIQPAPEGPCHQGRHDQHQVQREDMDGAVDQRGQDKTPARTPPVHEPSL